MSSSVYVATCRRDGSSWSVEIPDLGCSAHAGRLSQVEEVARGLVAHFAGEDARSAQVVVDLVVDNSVRDLLDAAVAARADAELDSAVAVTLRRRLARGLAAEGFTVRDIAGLLGLSYGRAQALVAGSEARPAPAVPQQPVARAHDSYRHEAFLYRGEAEFLSGTLPFVREGVASGQPVMVAVVAPRLDLLRAALGGDAEGVHFVDMAELGRNPARIIPGWLEFVEEHSGRGRPVRGVGEPIWAGRRPAEVAECQLHEALLNLAIDPDTPLWLRCPYDLDALDESVAGEALHSHPALVEAGGYRGSTAYGGAHHAAAMFAGPLPEPPVRTTDLPFDGASLAGVRRFVRGHAVDAGLDPDRVGDLALAATELATNSVRHGGGRGSVRVWRDHDAFAFEVQDAGRLGDLLVGRRTPPLDAQRGRGVWLAHQLADLVQIRSASDGTAARVLTWR